MHIILLKITLFDFNLAKSSINFEEIVILSNINNKNYYKMITYIRTFFLFHNKI